MTSPEIIDFSTLGHELILPQLYHLHPFTDDLFELCFQYLIPTLGIFARKKWLSIFLLPNPIWRHWHMILRVIFVAHGTSHYYIEALTMSMYNWIFNNLQKTKTLPVGYLFNIHFLLLPYCLNSGCSPLFLATCRAEKTDFSQPSSWWDGSVIRSWQMTDTV